MKKIIFLKVQNGFGNKIFDLLLALYVNNVNGGDWDIYVNLQQSYHEKPDDYTIFEIFPNLVGKFTIIDNPANIDLTKYNCFFMRCDQGKSRLINDFKVDSKYDFIEIKLPWGCYKDIYAIYHKLLASNSINGYFNFNEKIVSKETLKLSKHDYLIIHIRYGDKLNLNIKKKKDFFFLNTPDFYKEAIQRYYKKMKIYIISDDIQIVKHFILNDKDHENVHVLDISWWDSFYLLTQSKYSILSISSFSIFSTFINKKCEKVYVVVRPDREKEFLEEFIINSTNWTKLNNQKYKLSYRSPLIREMISYRKKNG